MGGAGALVVEIVAATVVVVVAGADVDPVRTEAGALQGNEGAVVEQREMQVRSGGAATLAERGVDVAGIDAELGVGADLLAVAHLDLVHMVVVGRPAAGVGHPYLAARQHPYRTGVGGDHAVGRTAPARPVVGRIEGRVRIARAGVRMRSVGLPGIALAPGQLHQVGWRRQRGLRLELPGHAVARLQEFRGRGAEQALEGLRVGAERIAALHGGGLRPLSQQTEQRGRCRVQAVLADGLARSRLAQLVFLETVVAPRQLLQHVADLGIEAAFRRQPSQRRRQGALVRRPQRPGLHDHQGQQHFRVDAVVAAPVLQVFALVAQRRRIHRQVGLEVERLGVATVEEQVVIQRQGHAGQLQLAE